MESGVSGDAARTHERSRLKHTLDISEIGYKLPDSNTAVFVCVLMDIYMIWRTCGLALVPFYNKKCEDSELGAIDGVVRKVTLLVNDLLGEAV
jgi:hypothetical protein